MVLLRIDQLADVLRHRNPPARVHGSALGVHAGNAGGDRDDPSNLGDGRRNHGRRQRSGRARRCGFADVPAKHQRAAVDGVKRVLLIGGSGQLGTAIRQRWSDCAIVAPAREELELADRTAMRGAIERFRPDVLVNAAAFHDVDRCEDEPRARLRDQRACGRSGRRSARARAARSSSRSAPTTFSTVKRPLRTAKITRRIRSRSTASRNSPANIWSSALRMRAFVVRTCGLYGQVDQRTAAANRSSSACSRSAAATRRCASLPTSSLRRRLPATSPTRLRG